MYTSREDATNPNTQDKNISVAGMCRECSYLLFLILREWNESCERMALVKS